MCEAVIVPFKVEHAVELSKVVRDPVENSNPITEATAKEYATRGPSYSFFMGDKLVACGGIMIIWPGVGVAWLMTDPEAVLRCVKSFFMAAVRFTRESIQEHSLVRVQASCRADTPAFSRLLEHLGFKREALMRKYGRDGSDQYLYSIVKGD